MSRLPRTLLPVATLLALFSWEAKVDAADPVRTNAVIAVGFDEPQGEPLAAITGQAKPIPLTTLNAPARATSPFWNQSGKSALVLDATKKQAVKLADLPFLDRPDAVTVSLYFLSLHPPTDGDAHGIFGKRSADSRGTNYAINYVPKSDLLQLYVNDGRGFRIASYSAAQALGTRRLVHLAATFEVADAPAPDADADRDDLLARLYVNGEAIAPKAVIGGEANGDEAWFLNVNVAGLLNDAPLMIGSSTPETEFTSCVVDDFLLFPRAISPTEARRLFLETAGPQGVELARRELQPRGVSPMPAITSISQRGLQIGKTSRLTIVGSGIGRKPRAHLPIAGLTQAVAKESTADRLIVDITIPPTASQGLYPLSVQTAGGISESIPIAVDRLPQLLVGDSAPDRPSVMPAAYSGVISGPAQPRIHFNAKKGDRFVAEVEARRIGSPIEPVLELKNAAGGTLAIEWGKSFLHGDARVETTIPADGAYFVELHDLAYSAAPESPFRIRIGDLHSVDGLFPPVAQRGSQTSIEPIGTGIPPGTLIAANLREDMSGLAKLLVAPASLDSSGPLPALRLSDAAEIVEVPQPNGQLQTLDARFADKSNTSLAINGRLDKPGESDRFALAVTPGQTLAFQVDGRSINSPIDATLAVYSHPEGKPLASDGGTPAASASGFQYAIPAGVTAVQIAVRDLYGRGGKHCTYRLKVAPAGQPDFSVSVLASRINVPQKGRTVAELQVDRKGYNGPIDLSVEGADGVTIMPAQLPAEGASRKTLITLAADPAKPIDAAQRVRIVARSVGVEPKLRRLGIVSASMKAEVSGFRDTLPIAARGEAPIQVEWPAMPAYLLKGFDAEWAVALAGDPKNTAWVRLSTVSTEASRQAAPNQPQKKPLIASVGEQGLPASAGKGALKVQVPLDVAEAAIDFAIKAEVLPHQFSDRVLATTYSPPVRVAVQDAAALNVDGGSLSLAAGVVGKIRGKIVRHPAFKEEVRIALTGLPAGYSSAPIALAADKSDFEIAVNVAAEAAQRTIPNLSLAITRPNGQALITQPIELKVAPAVKK